MGRNTRYLAGLAVLVLVAGFNKASADNLPRSTDLQPHHGPWLIYVSSFKGEMARTQASKLLTELREKHGCNAYLHSISGLKRRKEMARREAIRSQSQYKRARIPTIRIVDEYAVLVGDYGSREAALAGLEGIRGRKDPSLFESTWAALKSPFVGMKKQQQDAIKKKSRYRIFSMGFVLPNPIQGEKAQAHSNQPAAAEFLTEMNQNEAFSLLNNRSEWTLLIKVISGDDKVVNQSWFAAAKQKLWGDKSASHEAAAREANYLASAISRRNWKSVQPHVLHTPDRSFVTVGGFASQDDPFLKELQKYFSDLNQIDGIPLMKQPTAMRVPK